MNKNYLKEDMVPRLTATQTNDKRILLTPQQVAEMIGISAGTLAVWRCTKRYPLPYVKFGGAVKYRREDVETFIVKRRVEIEDVV